MPRVCEPLWGLQSLSIWNSVVLLPCCSTLFCYPYGSFLDFGLMVGYFRPPGPLSFEPDHTLGVSLLYGDLPLFYLPMVLLPCGYPALYISLTLSLGRLVVYVPPVPSGARTFLLLLCLAGLVLFYPLFC